MKISRLLLAAAIIVAALWTVRHRAEIAGKLLPAAARTDRPARPADDALTEATREADKAQGGGVTENMTPDQVRSLLGSPDAIESSSNESGRTRERWIYRHAGKVVVFENGVAVSVQSP